MTKKTAPKPAATPAAAPVATTAKRIAPDLTPITDDVAMPERQNRRGSKSLYDFDGLTVGKSFGVKNKNAAGMASIISNQNRKHVEPAKDEDGNVVFKTQELKGIDGTVTMAPTDKPETIATKHFFAIDCDPKTDPHGASVRVFRDV